MLRKVLVLLTVMFVLPIVSTANAWTLSTRVLTPGGTLQVGTTTPQAIVTGTVTTSYASDVVVEVRLNASPGYQILPYDQRCPPDTAPRFHFFQHRRGCAPG